MINIIIERNFITTLFTSSNESFIVVSRDDRVLCIIDYLFIVYLSFIYYLFIIVIAKIPSEDTFVVHRRNSIITCDIID